MMKNIQTAKTLNNGIEIPGLGLGVIQSPAGETTKNVIRYAVEAGYHP